MELISIKDYCEREEISDAGARKRVSSKLVKSVLLDEMLYIVEENGNKQREIDKQREKIKQQAQDIRTLKSKLKNSTDRIKLIKAEAPALIDPKEYINKLEAKIEKLEAKIDEITDKKEALFEKVIGHFSMLQIPQK